MESIPPNPVLEFLPNTLENIRKMYNLDKERMNESVDILEEWVKKQNHFVKKDFSRLYLEKTIILCKGSVEKAKEKMDKLCTLKTLLPKFFISCNVKRDLKITADTAYVIPLPKMTADYYRLFLIKSTDKQFSSLNIVEHFRLNIITSEYLIVHDYVNGFVIINDYRDVNLMDLMTKLDLVELQQFITIVIEGYGARMKGIHILTQSTVIDIFIKTVKPFLSSKIASRLHVHPTVESLHMVIDKELLPEEYGGEVRSIDKLQSEWIEVLSSDEHENYMNMMNKACTDESCRLTETFNEYYMGLPGTFRSLTVD